MGQQLAGEAEAERFFAADSHRRQRVGLVGETESVPRVVLRQGSSLFIAQEVQVPRHRAAGHLELPHEIAAVGQIAGLGALAHHLQHTPDAVVLGAGSRLHFPQSFFRGMPLDDTPSFLQWTAWWSKSIVRSGPGSRRCGSAYRGSVTPLMASDSLKASITCQSSY